MGFHAKTKPPRSGNSEGVLVLVLTALAHQAVKPLAEIVCNYFCCDSLEKRDKIIHMGLPPPFRDWGIGEGPQCQYNTSFDLIQQKAPGTANTGGFVF